MASAIYLVAARPFANEENRMPAIAKSQYSAQTAFPFGGVFAACGASYRTGQVDAGDGQ